MFKNFFFTLNKCIEYRQIKPNLFLLKFETKKIEFIKGFNKSYLVFVINNNIEVNTITNIVNIYDNLVIQTYSGKYRNLELILCLNSNIDLIEEIQQIIELYNKIFENTRPKIHILKLKRQT